MPIKLHRDQFRWTNGRGHDQKPVLYSQKANTHGLGKKEHDFDHWWATAFDNQLKSLDVRNSKSGEVTVKQTETNATPLGMGIKSRYYIKFVLGGILTGEVEKKKDVMVTTVTTEEGGEGGVKVKEKKEKGKRKEKKEKKKKEGLRNERKEKKRLKRLLEKEMALIQAMPVEG